MEPRLISRLVVSTVALNFRSTPGAVVLHFPLYLRDLRQAGLCSWMSSNLRETKDKDDESDEKPLQNGKLNVHATLGPTLMGV